MLCTVHKHYSKGMKSPVKHTQKIEKNADSPNARFGKLHAGHPDLPEMQKAREEGEIEKYGHLRNRIAGDGWSGFLAGVRTSDTKSIF